MIVKCGDRVFKTLYFIGNLDSSPCYSLVEIEQNHTKRSDLILHLLATQMIVGTREYIFHHEPNSEYYILPFIPQ